MFVCYSQCRSMSIFKFLKHYYETRDIEFDWYNDIYRVILDCSNFRVKDGFSIPKQPLLKDKFAKTNRQTSLPQYNEGALDAFVKYYPPEWLDEGITKAAMDKYDIRYSISQNKIIIPHRDAAGRLVGIRGRALNELEIENVGKYMPVKLEQTWYTHPLSMNLYGLYENKGNIKKARVCYVFEGEKSVLICDSFSRPNCAVASCGSNFNIYQLHLLLSECNPLEVVLCFDNEELPNKFDYFMKLYNICLKYKNYVNFSFVYDRKHLLQLKEAPVDRGEDIFNKLIESRVRI